MQAGFGVRFHDILHKMCPDMPYTSTLAQRASGSQKDGKVDVEGKLHREGQRWPLSRALVRVLIAEGMKEAAGGEAGDVDTGGESERVDAFEEVGNEIRSAFARLVA